MSIAIRSELFRRDPKAYPRSFWTLEGSSEEGITELRIRRSNWPILFADLWPTHYGPQPVEVNPKSLFVATYMELSFTSPGSIQTVDA